ncbi:unnamed protein product [Callosobruchus maculatus]|uniref:Uncharacterized protein n=1 Tax=Callosobruchus maculatus TaxID=64391 RepID=A0A653BR15_CALMS|nr:unnamed protein product [Callosobruchus maculatus]
MNLKRKTLSHVQICNRTAYRNMAAYHTSFGIMI